jgi:tetratricopeptide (TPR) repeat protein
MGLYYWATGDHTRTIEAAQRALACAATVGDIGLRVRASHRLGVAYYALGDYARALPTLRESAAVLLEGDLRNESFFGVHGPLPVNSLSTLVLCLAEQGDFDGAMAAAAQAVRLAEAAEHGYSLAMVSWALGQLYLGQGDVDKAIAVLERGLARCPVDQMPARHYALASVLGAAYAQVGRQTEALTLLEEAAERTPSALRVTCLSEGYLRAGCIAEATAVAGRALDLARHHGERGSEAWVFRLLGEIAAHADPPEVEQAESYYRQALTLAKELGMRPLVAHCHLGLGTLFRQIGRDEQAQAELTTAAEMYRAMEMTFWLERAETAQPRVHR